MRHSATGCWIIGPTLLQQTEIVTIETAGGRQMGISRGRDKHANRQPDKSAGFKENSAISQDLFPGLWSNVSQNPYFWFF